MKVPNGPLYLRILVSHITIDSRSTVSYIRMTLSELDGYMVSVNINATTLDKFARLQTDTLKARGETSSDIMVNHFKSYLATLDI